MLFNSSNRSKTSIHVATATAITPQRSSSLLENLLATAVFQCWPILLFFTAWAALISYLTSHVYKNLAFQPTLLTVIGTVLGFIISYRTTSSFERYNEGRRLWSQIILNSRNLARLVWFHVPDMVPIPPGTKVDPLNSEDERRSRGLIEKKTVVNLIEAFAVATKHYLRGEEGIYYTDLYFLVKHLPSYALPPGIPSAADLASNDPQGERGGSAPKHVHEKENINEDIKEEEVGQQLPVPATSSDKAALSPLQTQVQQTPSTPRSPTGKTARFSSSHAPRPSISSSVRRGPPPSVKAGMTGDELWLQPARMPPQWCIFDLFPFSLLGKILVRKGKNLKGRRAARLRARREGVSHNLPLEISLYLSSYVVSLQNRKVLDPPTTTNFMFTINGLVDAVTGLERILTTPIPYSYSTHLWLVTIVYNLLLPFQVWNTLKWLTIPATFIAAFVFFGFLIAGEEIENPFGYDKNDLNMDHFTHNIIRNELRAITSTPAPDLSVWAFSPENDLVFAAGPPMQEERVAPAEWLRRGSPSVRHALSLADGK